MKKVVSSILIVFILASCAGRTPNPVMSSQLGDRGISCESLENEIASNQQEINRIAPNADKSGQNIALGITGLFLLVPWFFMDFSHADETELNALRQRNVNLTSLAGDKHCSLDDDEEYEPKKKR